MMIVPSFDGTTEFGLCPALDFYIKLMTMKWKYTPISPDDIQDFSKLFRLPPLYTQILLNRGIRSIRDKEMYFDKTHNDLHDPFLMKGMDLAVDRITIALKNKESIMIYGDYDVDGVTSTSLLMMFLAKYAESVIPYIPEREKDGYGMSQVGMDYAKEQGVTLIISCDCGITAVKETDYAKENGIDIIITDHHEPGASLPAAVTILDPKQSDDTYPFRNLCGVGVAYKLIQALCISWNEPGCQTEQYLDLVAIGTAADIVPLVNENRILMKEGIAYMRDGHASLGIRELMNIAGVEAAQISVEKIVFNLAPRLNAVGRMGQAMRAVTLLTTEKWAEAKDFAFILNEENLERRKVESDVAQEAILLYNQKYGDKTPNSIVLAGNWHPGVIGIVSSKIRERYNRPVFLIALNDGIGKGSGRSMHDIDLFSICQKCSEHLVNFGGHQMAAGLTVKEDKLSDFESAFEKAVTDCLKADTFLPAMRVDADVEIRDINSSLMNFLDGMAPFGPANMKPKFVCKDVSAESVLILKDAHLKFKIRQDNYTLECLGWNMSINFEWLMETSQKIDLVCVPVYNEWNGNRKIQCIIKDMRPAGSISFI